MNVQTLERTFLMDLHDLPDFLTVGEAAAILRIGRSTVYLLARQYIDSGGKRGLPARRIGHQLRILRSGIEAWTRGHLDPSSERSAS
jgi:excisionase family DNA binding protein